MRYEESLPHELAAEIERMPVAYLPWGAHEWHGRHNPVGVDGLKARFLAEELCEAAGGVVFPPVYCGCETIGRLGFPYCIDFSESTIQTLAREYLSGIAAIGFRVIVVTMGHWPPKHWDVISRAAQEFEREHPEVRAWVLRDDTLTEPFGFPEDHGGIGETSYMMAAVPGKVDFTRLPADRPLVGEKDGVFGPDPRDASVERGREMAGIYVREAARRIREMLDYGNATGAIGCFRSGESNVSTRHDDYLEEAYADWEEAD